VVDLRLFEVKDAEKIKVFKHTPIPSEGGLADFEFGFGQTTSGYIATAVRYPLDTPLGFDKLVDLSAQGNVFPADDFFGNHPENERSVTDPGKEIGRVDGTRAGDDDSGLMAEIFGSDEKIT